MMDIFYWFGLGIIVGWGVSPWIPYRYHPKFRRRLKMSPELKKKLERPLPCPLEEVRNKLAESTHGNAEREDRMFAEALKPWMPAMSAKEIEERRRAVAARREEYAPNTVSVGPGSKKWRAQ